MDAITAPADLSVPAVEDLQAGVASYALTTLESLEDALRAGLHEEWRRLVESDPRSSVYQGAGWCVPWYRCYADAYDPFVIVVTAGARIVGLVPMAVERATRQFAFASNTMADYRDIVALPGYRPAVVRELVKVYVSGGFRNPLEIGWLDPASDTPALVAGVCRELGLRHATRHQPCWRWFPQPGENLQKKFSRVRTHLNYFKRLGDVSFDVITDAAGWASFCEEFYRQHSLRQLQASREVSFDDVRKQRLYDAVFTSPEIATHVTACRVNGRMISGHVGLVWRDVLMLGAPSISLEDEHRSPAVILMTWIIQNAAQLGLAGFDLTIGESEFKRRLGNQCVELTTVDVFGRSRDFYLRSARARVVDSARRAVESVAGEGAWKHRIKPVAASLQYKRKRVAELGLLGTLGKAISAVPGHPPREMVLSMTKDACLPLDTESDPAPYQLHDNRLEDLLLWGGTSASTSSSIAACAAAYGRNRAAGHTLHTLVADGALAAWCFGHADEAGREAVVYDVAGAPEFSDRRACEILVRRVVDRHFGAGISRARVVLLEEQRTLRRALGAAGFRVEPSA